MNSSSCAPFVGQMIATEMEKQFDKAVLKCAVLVVETGSATTLRHIVRGQIDRTQQLAVVQQLYRVVKAVEALHDRQFIHGGLHLDALVIHTSQHGSRGEGVDLKFDNLHYATRFGAPIQTCSSDSIEFIPPEMARHQLCCPDSKRSSLSRSISSDVECAADHGIGADEQPDDDDAFKVLRASPAYDVWALGVLIIKIYSTAKQLDEFQGCLSASDYYFKIADPSFSFDRSLALYVHHDDVRELARLCLRRDYRKRPKISSILRHRVFRAYDKLEEQAAAALSASFHGVDDRSITATERECSPPSLWLFLPPRELGLNKTRSIDDWVNDLTQYQQEQRLCSTTLTSEMLFPVIFLCEDTESIAVPCSAKHLNDTRVAVPASLLSLVMPIVQETTLLLEARAILSDNPPLNVADVSGLGVHEWNEMMKFYRALEKMMIAPISSFSLLMLKPLEEMLAKQDKELARQVRDEVRCLVFSREKREYVVSLLDILQTTQSSRATTEDNFNSDEGCTSSTLDSSIALQPASKLTDIGRNGLQKTLACDSSSTISDTRWLCRNHLHVSET
ncbi:hypothetical protein PINS_up008785 [Pythium insidiosum]|nr:hypothetical protein PINS_up008785 [Pythium insidiosum]